jgi:ABC-type uncharacterized transport system substrate-binding protein
MIRREFLFGLGATASWVVAALAQQPALPVIGFLRSTALENATERIAAFRRGLGEAGYIEGKSVAIEYHSADNRPDQLTALLADLIRRRVALIVTNTPAALAAKAATTTIPIVFATGSDPIRDGLVPSLSRPGGNITGISFFGSVLGSKRLQLLRQLAPNARNIGFLVNPSSPETEAERADIEAAALAVGQKLITIEARSEHDIETAFDTLAHREAGALISGGGTFLYTHRQRIMALAARKALPAIYSNREYVQAGGLASYGASAIDAYRQAGIYAARILKGEKPADLPVTQPTTFEFVLNLRTAKTLGLEIPPNLLALADEVIE